MQTLTTNDEQKLLDGVKQAVDLVENHDLSPSAAVEKVAREEQMGPGYIRLMCHAYNTGRQTAQREANGLILDKMASFRLADAREVTRAIYPEETVTPKQAALASAISEDYDRPPTWIDTRDHRKAASVELTYDDPKPEEYAADPLLKLSGVYADLRKKQAHAERLRGKHAEARDKMYSKLADLSLYFKQASMDRIPSYVAEDAAITYYGPAAKTLFGYIHSRNFSKDKRAADLPSPTQEVDLSSQPFPLIRECLDIAKEVNAADVAYNASVEDVNKTREEQLSPFSPTALGTKQASVSTSLITDDSAPSADDEKEAGLGMGIMGAAASKSLIDRALSPKSQKDLIEKEWMELESPEHENDLRKIRIKAWLNSVMSDSENPISSYDPDEILTAYNELAQLAPRAAEQPAIMQPLLARRLEGTQEPFEVKEISDLEKNLRDVKAPVTPTQRLLTDAPESILG